MVLFIQAMDCPYTFNLAGYCLCWKKKTDREPQVLLKRVNQIGS